MEAEERLDEEQEPLISRSSPSNGHEQFQEARVEAAQEAAMESGWFAYTMISIATLMLMFWLYVTIRSWFVLIVYYSSPCDQPLSDWLLTKLLLDIVSNLAQQRGRTVGRPRRITWLFLGLQNVWLVLGFHWCAECRTCQSTSPELFNWVRFLNIFGTVTTVILMLLPVLFHMAILLVVYLAGSGRLRSNRAAREDTLTLLAKVEYSPELFADSANANDNRPAGECCCCCDNFNAEQKIVRTPCEHYFHQECLGEWLKLASSCPICRCDLDAATQDMEKSKAHQDDASKMNAEEVVAVVVVPEAPTDLSSGPSASSGAQSSTHVDE